MRFTNPLCINDIYEEFFKLMLLDQNPPKDEVDVNLFKSTVAAEFDGNNGPQSSYEFLCKIMEHFHNHKYFWTVQYNTNVLFTCCGETTDQVDSIHSISLCVPNRTNTTEIDWHELISVVDVRISEEETYCINPRCNGSELVSCVQFQNNNCTPSDSIDQPLPHDKPLCVMRKLFIFLYMMNRKFYLLTYLIFPMVFTSKLYYSIYQ